MDARPASSDTTLGDLIALVYQEFFERSGDEEFASVVAAVVANEVLAKRSNRSAEVMPN